MASTSRSARYAKWLSIPLGLVISALLIWQASYAAFTSTAESLDNTWSTGHLTLQRDGESTTPLFEEAELAPGDHGSKEVTVTYDGTVDALVSFYGVETSADGLADHIDLRVEGSQGGSFGSDSSGVIFEGKLSTFLLSHGSFENGTKYEVTGPQQLQGSFKFSWEVRPDAPQSASTQVNFVVKAQSLPSST